MQWQLLDAHNALAAIDRLGAGAQPSGYQKPRWLRELAVATRLDSSAQCLFLVGSIEGEAIDAILPLCVRRVFGMRVLEWLGQDICDENGPVLTRRAHEILSTQGVVEVWRAAARLTGGADLVIARKQPVEFGGRPNPFAAVSALKEADNTHEIDLTRISERSSLISAKSRRRLRQKQNALAKYGKVEIRPARTSVETKAAVGRLVTLKNHQLETSGQSNPFADAGFRAFLSKMVMNGTLKPHCVWLDGQPIAIILLLRHGTTQHLYQMAYDGAWGKYSPGRILTIALIEQAIDDDCAVFDFGFGNEVYKRDFTNRSRVLTCSSIPLTARGLWGAKLFGMFHRTRRTIKETDWLRSMALGANRLRTRRRRKQGAA